MKETWLRPDWTARLRGVVFALLTQVAATTGASFTLPDDALPTITVRVDLTTLGVPTVAEAAMSVERKALGIGNPAFE